MKPPAFFLRYETLIVLRLLGISLFVFGSLSVLDAINSHFINDHIMYVLVRIPLVFALLAIALFTVVLIVMFIEWKFKTK